MFSIQTYIPVETGIDKGGDGPGGALTSIDDGVLRLDVRRPLHVLHAHILFALGKRRCIDRDEEGFASARLGLAHKAFCDAAVRVDVELKELNLS